MKKLVGILVVLLAISVAFSATVTLSPTIKGTLWGHAELNKDGLETALGINNLSVSFGAKADVSDITLDLTITLPSDKNTVILKSFTVENDAAALSWYAAKSLAGGTGANPGLKWFKWYDDDAANVTMALVLKELGLSVGTQEAATDKIALFGSWDIFSFAAQTGLDALKWSEDVIAEATFTPLPGLTISGGVKATDLLGAAVFDYVVDAKYTLNVGLLTLTPYARYSDTKGQHVGLGVAYEIGVLEITGDVKYDIEANAIETWVQPVISKDGIGWAGVKFGYDYDFGAATQAMTLGFLVKSNGWAAGPVSVDLYVGSGDYNTFDANGFGAEIIGDVLADVKDISVYGEAALDLLMGNFKPSITAKAGYYFLDASKKLVLGLSFPVLINGFNFKAGVDVFDPADSWFAGLYYNYEF
ncbi:MULTISPECIES: hypothetical protein [unclassified Mesotoga]|uniref:hypothetical protein n=1 Tax=unclassified Mesotoga TaxID=1184398 RepID=UPI000DA6610C|nr:MULTISPECIES: hypothetical protein [unclassified Mesotoga]PZC52996.1 hypothetical protein LH53_01755 [Mesotoga sp. TolDC]